MNRVGGYTNSLEIVRVLDIKRQIYADLMDEARLRIHAIRDGINARHLWVPRLLQEFCYLQLRMLCETIAIGCLVAHDDVKDRATLKSWKIPEIMKRLEELNVDFYPRGVRFRKDGGTTHLDEYPVPQLSRAALVKLWNDSGSFLHRGSAKNLVAAHGTLLNVDLDTVISYGQKVLNLLEQHVISSADKKTHLVVALASDDAGGNAIVGVAQSPRT
jgi:hypothetical protein